MYLKGDTFKAYFEIPNARLRIDDYEKFQSIKSSYTKSIKFNALYRENSLDRFFEKLELCGNTLIWGYDPKDSIDQKYPESPSKLLWGNFCKDPFCPLCSRKKSLQLGRSLNSVMDNILAAHPSAKFYHLVLTVRNITLDEELPFKISHLQVSFRRFSNAYLSRFYDGYFCSLEFTLRIAPSGAIELHPHYHVIVCQKEYKYSHIDNIARSWGKAVGALDYRRTDDGNRIKDSDGRYVLDGYVPNCWISIVDRDDNSAFLEVTKYIFDFSTLEEFINKYPGRVNFQLLYESFKGVTIHRGGRIMRLSAQNPYFVQSVMPLPEYNPTRLFVAYRYLFSEDPYKLNAVVSLDDFILGDDDVAPASVFIRSYVKHQLYQYGFYEKIGKHCVLPSWFDDLTVDSSPDSAPPDNIQFANTENFSQISIFESCFNYEED